jgi:hypothetical protein
LQRGSPGGGLRVTLTEEMSIQWSGSFSSPNPAMWEWESMKPGSTVAPSRSTTSVFRPRTFLQQVSPLSTQVMVAPLVATHWATVPLSSMVTMVPLT